MKKRIDVIAWMLFVIALVVIGIEVISKADAATKGDPQPAASYGAVNVLTGSATKVPTTTMSNRNAIGITNLGPNTIYCGWNTTVTTATGFPVIANASLSVDIVAVTQNAKPGTVGAVAPQLYCIAASADQTSPSNTRYIEVR